MSNEEKMRRYSQALQNYLIYYNQRKDKPMKIKSEPSAEPHKKEEECEDQQPRVVPDTIERDIVNALPKSLKNRGKIAY